MSLTLIHQNQITFTDARFYTVPETDIFYPSVTTYLEAYPKPYQLIQWMKEMGSKSDEIRDAAGDRGSNVHNLTEMYDMGIECELMGDNNNPLYSIDEWKMFERYVDFTERFKPAHELIEQMIICPAAEAGGTVDRVSVINGKRYLVDIKTSNGIYNTFWLQLAAYRQMLEACEGIRVDGVAVLWLNAKTRTNGRSANAIQGEGWQMVMREDTTADLKLFEAVKLLWKAEHGSDKPKSFTYQLKHQKNEMAKIGSVATEV